MKNVLVRSLSGLVYIAVMVGALFAGGLWLMALMCLLALMGIYEFTSMTHETKFPRIAFLLDSVAAMSLIFLLGNMASFNYIGGRTCMAVMMGTLYLRCISQMYASHGNGVNSLARSIFSQFYIALPLALIPVLCSMASPYMVLALYIFIWVNDTGAFCVGSMIGRHRLFERISPKKSWEGFFGGLLFSILASLIIKACIPSHFEAIGYVKFCLLAAFVTVMATFGDLLESLVKRTCNVKDSGNIIPGHGGILDRIDSILLVIPTSILFISLLD